MATAENVPSSVKQSIFIMRHGERHDSLDYNWKKTARRPYDTPLSRKGHYETPKLVRQRLLGKVYIPVPVMIIYL